MKSLRTFSTLVLVALVMMASAASAEPTVSLRIGDDNWEAATIRPNQQVDLNIYLSGIDASINAVEYKVNLPGDLIVMSNTYGFPGALDFGNASTVGNAIGFGECVAVLQVTQGHPDLLVHTMRVFSLGYCDLSPITLTAFEGGSDSPTTPRYSTCGGAAMSLASSGAQIAVTTVPNDSDSWGAVKALY